jgi:transposase-like protein
MAKLAARDLQKEAAWRRRLSRHAQSGQSVRAWCRKHGVTETAFYWWRKELARRDAEKRNAAFVPVHVTEAPAWDDEARIEIVLTDGRRVRVTGAVNGPTLTAVLDALERRAC